MVAGAWKLAPSSGEVSVTAGGILELTFTVTGDEVPTYPSASVATAVRLYVPAATLLHVAV